MTALHSIFAYTLLGVFGGVYLFGRRYNIYCLERTGESTHMRSLRGLTDLSTNNETMRPLPRHLPRRLQTKMRIS